jgi:serine/threonine protein kinase
MDQKFCNNKLENGILCGSFGCVVKVEDTETQKHYAGKISAASDELLVQEYNILKKLNENESNPHILQLKKKEGVVEDLCDFKFSEDYELINEERNEVLKEFRKDDNCKMMLMEYLEGGDLFDYISSLHDKRIEFDIDKVREIFKQIIEGIEFCHDKNIYHFDLKPQNFVFTDKSKSSIKIIDFGLAKEGCDFKIDIDKIGTIGYFAPELLRIFISKDNIINSKCSACDIFSIGIILLRMVRYEIIIEHEKLLQESNVLGYYKRIRDSIKNYKDNDFTEEFKELLLGMLEDEPSNRLTIAEIKETAWYNDVLFEIDQSNEDLFKQSRSQVSEPEKCVLM